MKVLWGRNLFAIFAERNPFTMNYPLISEYIEAIKSSEDNFEELTNLRPILSDDGQPVMTSGNFAVVFKMEDVETGKLYALKCFTKEQEGREEAYKQIAEELEGVDSPYIVPIKYLEKELFVDSKQTDETEFPVLLMDWVDGKTLDKYLRENLDDKYALEMLAYRFSQLAQWIIPQPFAHGDLKPDNILVREDGTLVLVDYDGMYVPVMKGQKARELGSPDFRHPLRTEDDFDEHIDDFPIVSILLSLKAISLNPQLLEEYGAADRLLFSENDFCDIANSNTMRCILGLIGNKEIAKAYSLFVVVLSEKRITQNSFSLVFKDKFQEELYDLVRFQSRFDNDIKFYRSFFLMNGLGCERDVKRAITLLMQLAENDYTNAQYLLGVCYQYGQGIIHNYEKSIKWYTKAAKMGHFGAIRRLEKATTDDLKNAWTDVFGVIYSADRKRLLRSPEDIKDYTIISGTTTICDYAFGERSSLVSITIPDSVVSIGEEAFYECANLVSIIIPDGVQEIRNRTFYDCESLASVTIPNSVESIGDEVFAGCQVVDINIPNNVRTIGLRSFWFCTRLKILSIPKNVVTIGESAFGECHSLEHIVVDINNNTYDSRDNCNAIIETKTNKLITGCKNTIIPNSVTSIGDYAFEGSIGLTTLVIPQNVIAIGDRVFCKCHGLERIVVDTNNNTYDSRNNCNAIIETKTNTLIAGCKNSIIPDDVTSLGNYAFMGCRDLTNLAIPYSVTVIGDNVFQGCRNLMTFYIANPNITIGANIFLKCKAPTILIPAGTRKEFEALLPEYKELIIEDIIRTKVTKEDLENAWTDEYGVMYSADRTRLLKAPEGIVEYKIKKNTLIVCDNAFKDCRKLSSIELPATIISIGDLAFQHCIFKTIQLPDSLIHIGGCAFTNNEDLTYINFPPNLHEIPIHNIIGGCKRLNDIKIETPLIKEKEGVLYSNDFKIVYSYLYQSNVLSIDLDNRAEIISSNAFWGSEIESIRLPKTLKKISQRAFTNCRKLHSINLPSFVNSIEGVTFFGCESLKVIDIPKNVTSIGDSAFRRCNSLTSIRIPDSVTEIGEYAFEGCSNLPSVEIPNSVTKIGKSAFWGCSGMTSINIPDSVTEIGDSAFWGCSGLMSITIPKGVTCIGAYAFHDCSNLTSIVIPDSVTKIGESAFGGCSGMTSINIPDSVTEIGEGAFWGCSGMTSINIPDSVTEIGDSAFRRCNSLTSIRIPDSVTKIGEYAFEGCSNLPSVEIPNSVTKIGKSAFWGCSGMTSINIPDSVTEIGEGAFYQCTSLTNITVASGNSTYDSRNGCNAIIETNSNTLIAGCKNTIIPSSVTKIGESAFGGCSGLTSIFIPSKVFSIGESAFSYCSGLTSIQVATPNLFYTSDNSNALIFNDIIEIEKSVLYILVRGCLKTKIPDYVTNIDAYAFSGCKGLKTITIPNRITSIGAYAFVNCSDMTQIIIPNNVKSLGDCVFLHCCSLTSIVIQNSALKIGRDTFYGCTNLKTIYIPEGTREKFEQLLPHDKNKLVEQK